MKSQSEFSRHTDFLHSHRKPLLAALVFAFGWWLAAQINAKMGHATLIYLGFFLVLALYVGHQAGKSAKSAAAPAKAKRPEVSKDDGLRPSARERLVALEAERDQLRLELAEERAIVAAMTEQLHPGRF